MTSPTAEDWQSTCSVRLRILAAEMENLGVDMDYYRGLHPMSQHGRGLIGAAAIMKSWALDIQTGFAERKTQND